MPISTENGTRPPERDGVPLPQSRDEKRGSRIVTKRPPAGSFVVTVCMPVGTLHPTVPRQDDGAGPKCRGTVPQLRLSSHGSTLR